VSLAVVGAELDGVRIGLRAAEGVITELGPSVDARPGDETINGAGCAIVPGLVNGHTHAAMTLFRGFGSDLPLMDWLHAIWPKEAELTDEDVYWGTRLACLEMIRSGTVRFWDMYWRPRAVARAVDDAGLRATVGLPLIDDLDPARGEALRAGALESLDELADAGPRVTASLTPHGTYTVSEPSLEWVAQTAAERSLPVQIHFLEVEDEVTGLRARVNETPSRYLERVGLLGPSTVLAHGVWLSEDDLDLVAARGATLVTNPVSNLKLAVGGIFPYLEARKRGIPVGLGTDGASSNNSLDLLQDVKVFALLQKHAHDDTTVLPAEEALRVATGALAPMLGGAAELRVGAPADFVLVRLDVPELTPGDLVPNLVYAASGSVVDTTVVDGLVLMRGRAVEGEEEVRARARESAIRLGLTR